MYAGHSIISTRFFQHTHHIPQLRYMLSVVLSMKKNGGEWNKAQFFAAIR
jgi:hypothetical protein